MDAAHPVALAGLRLFLVDQDGTVFLGEQLLPGARRFFDLLTARGREYLFLTNNSSQDAAYYVQKLGRLGLPVTPRQVMTSGDATTSYLQGRHPGARVFLLGTPTLEREVRHAGFTLVPEPASPADVDLVLLGFDKTLTYRKLELAAGLLLAGLPYYATHGDLVCPTPAGPIPDAGSMILLLQGTTGRTPTVIGKPETLLVDMACQRFGIGREQTAMVGDRLYTDMEMGRRAGIASLLVLSGETRSLPPEGDPRVTSAFAHLGALADALEAEDEG